MLLHWPIIVSLAAMMAIPLVGQRIERYRVRYYGPTAERSYSPIAVRWHTIDRHDEVTYVGGAAWLADGNWGFVFRDAYAREYRDKAVPLPILTMTSLGLLVRLAGGAEAGLVLAQALSNALAMLMVYLVVLLAGRGRLLALVAAVGTVFTSQWVDFLLGHRSHFGTYFPINLIFPPEIAYISMNYSRVPFNGLTFPWLAFGVGAVAWLLTDRRKAAIVTAGVGIGVQPMVYPYFATSWLLGLPVLFGWLAWRRDWATAKALFAAGAIAAVVALPAMVAQWQFIQIPWHTDYYAAISYAMDLNTVPMLLLSLAVMAGAFLVRGDRMQATMAVLGAVMLGAWFSTQARHLTGYDMQIHHWNHRVFQPLLQVALFLAVGYGIRRLVGRYGLWDRWRVFAPTITGMVIVFGFMQMAAAAIHTSYGRTNEYIGADERAAYDWLRSRDGIGDAVVLSLSPETNHLLRPLVGSYNYIPLRFMSALPNAEVQERWVDAYRFYGVRASFFDSLMHPGLRVGAVFRRSEQDPVWSYELIRSMFSSFNLQFSGPEYALPDTVRADMNERFASIADPDSALRRFGVDYVWQGAYERGIGLDSLEAFRNVEPVFARGSVRIYRVSQPVAGE